MISIEKNLISTESGKKRIIIVILYSIIYTEISHNKGLIGYKEPRVINIMAEEWVYIGNKKILVYMTQRPLEGDPPQVSFKILYNNNNHDYLIININLLLFVCYFFFLYSLFMILTILI